MSRSVRRRFGALVLVAILACGVTASAQGVKEFDPRLYAPSPPPGSSYVRVVNAGTAAANVAIGSAAPLTLDSSHRIATAYRVVPGRASVAITVDGKESRIAVPPDKFLTVVYRPGGAKLTTITDDPGEDNPLLAQLRFYNLVAGCPGSLALEKGPSIFSAVAPNEEKSRSINPVVATLTTMCGSRAGTSLKLPLLKARDRYSIFLVGHSSKPVAVGNADSTEPFKGG